MNKTLKATASIATVLMMCTGCAETTAEVSTTTQPLIYVEEGQYVNTTEADETTATSEPPAETSEATEKLELPLCGDINKNPLQGQITKATAMIQASKPITIHGKMVEDKQFVLKKSRKDDCLSVVEASNIEGDLVDVLQESQKFDTGYTAYYDIYGDYLENMEFSLEKSEPSENDKYTVLGISYENAAISTEDYASVQGTAIYNTVMSANVHDCEKVIVDYNKGITVYGNKDEFTIGVITSDKNEAEQLGFYYAIITGTTQQADVQTLVPIDIEDTTALVLSLTDYGFHLYTETVYYDFKDVTVMYIPYGCDDEITANFGVVDELYYNKADNTVGTSAVVPMPIFNEGAAIN